MPLQRPRSAASFSPDRRPVLLPADKQADSWNPSRFDASDWIALMKRAGIKYFDFTAKHCEGFSMFDTSTVLEDCWDFDDTGQ